MVMRVVAAVTVPMLLGAGVYLRGDSASPPRISSLSPTSVVGSAFALTITGDSFDPAGAVGQVYRPSGDLMGGATLESRSSTRIVIRPSLAGAAPGTYTVKVRNPDGQLSDAAALTLRTEIAVSPASGIPGTPFHYSGRGFAGSSGITSHLKRPDGTEFLTLQLWTNPRGEFAHIVDSSPFATGTYELWAIDNQTGVSSDHRTFQVVSARPSPSPPPD